MDSSLFRQKQQQQMQLKQRALQLAAGNPTSSQQQLQRHAAAAAASPQAAGRAHYSNRQQAPEAAAQHLLSSLSGASTNSASSQEPEGPLLGHTQQQQQQQQHRRHHHNQQQQQHFYAQHPTATLSTQRTNLSADEQHQQETMQQQQRRHRHYQQHRQATLAAQQLAPPTSKQQTASQLSSDQATSSSSEQTIDELHQLALSSQQHSVHQHRLRSYAAAADSNSLQLTGGAASNRFLLGVLFTLTELLLFGALLLWFYWIYQHDEGLAWHSDRRQQFNAHAALMLLGFIFLAGQAMLIHRSFQCCQRVYTKIMHTILLVLATGAIAMGLVLGYTAQENVGANNKPIQHFYSLHAWCGLAACLLFALQFATGFVSFLLLLCCRQATLAYRTALLPIHRTFGLIIFSLAIAASLMGLLQTARSRLSAKLNKIDYHELAESGIVINLIGVCLICLAILMPYIIRNLDIKRPFKTELNRRLERLSKFDMRI